MKKDKEINNYKKIQKIRKMSIKIKLTLKKGNMQLLRIILTVII